jgi:uncharacterized protein YqeY
MDFEKHLTDQLKEAMKSGDKTRLMAIRAVKAVLTNERTRSSGPLEEADAIRVIGAYRKKMAGALDQYRESKRDDLVAAAETEIGICDTMLPKQMSEEDLAKIVDEMINETGATSMKDLGKLMGPIMQKVAGQADGNVVRKMVTQRLGG